MTQLKTIQIATFGSDGQEGIASGIRNFPVHKLALVCYSEDKQKAEEFARKIFGVLGVRATVNVVTRENVIRDTMERVSEILTREGKDYQQVLMNVSSGNKLIGCAALSAAFVNGIKTFGMDESGMPLMMPVLKLSYNEIISEAKLKILKAINDQGGSVESFEQLKQASGFGRPYGADPYGDYYASPSIWFPVSNHDDRLGPKEIVIGLEHNAIYRAYPLSEIEKDHAINDDIGERQILIASHYPFMARAFDRTVDGQVLDFEYKDGQMTDRQTGSVWDFDGTATEGRLEGKQLKRLPFDQGFWFEWVAFHPETELY